ncbi:hypothetical protein GSU68_02245 [Rathayibacter sp. VKM Ac-2759]|uniref:hypothetical protein n=1 Tax=Rathayibacter sp. VKM Ac-2759 TaxID=2609252 RepID=UPI001317D273|nr:hypothetical protein [Rathayibacter sp. VKM Ac-2759]QHC65514.1 hypothetical protein GSU68_02245 [Rathayibacter sp. VKM Ac-2759]
MSLTRTPLEKRVRAARRVSSLPLVISGVGVIAAGLVPLAGSPLFFVGYLVPAVTSIALWVALKAAAARAGVGMGRERIGLVAAIVTVVSVLTLLITMFAGPAFLVGVLLFVVGWRLENRTQWIAGVLVAAASPLLSYSFLQNAASGWLIPIDAYRYTPLTVDDAVLAGIGLALTLMGVRVLRQETERVRATIR